MATNDAQNFDDMFNMELLDPALRSNHDSAHNADSFSAMPMQSGHIMMDVPHYEATHDAPLNAGNGHAAPEHMGLDLTDHQVASNHVAHVQYGDNLSHAYQSPLPQDSVNQNFLNHDSNAAFHQSLGQDTLNGNNQPAAIQDDVDQSQLAIGRLLSDFEQFNPNVAQNTLDRPASFDVLNSSPVYQNSVAQYDMGQFDATSQPDMYSPSDFQSGQMQYAPQNVYTQFNGSGSSSYNDPSTKHPDLHNSLDFQSGQMQYLPQPTYILPNGFSSPSPNNPSIGTQHNFFGASHNHTSVPLQAQPQPQPNNAQLAPTANQGAVPQPRGTQRQRRRKARDNSAVPYSLADKHTIVRMMEGNNTPEQAEKVAQLLPGNRTGHAVLTKWRRMKGIYSHHHPERQSGGGSGPAGSQ